MNKEDLLAYKEKLSQLSEVDKKERYRYLKAIADGKVLGPRVGYSSIDMQWLGHFSNTAIDALVEYIEVDESMYQTLCNYAINHVDQVAFEYLGTEITYLEILKNIDKVANALVAIGVEENEIIPIVLPNIPETRYIMYACSKIGAIPNPIMPTISEVDFETVLKNTKCNKVFVMEGLYKKFLNLLNKHNICKSNVVEINPLLSSSGLIKAISLIKGNLGETDYESFIKKGYGVEAKPVLRKASDVALIEQTGGTTALTTKSVLITNGNVLASNYQLENGEFKFKIGDSLLDILLPSISYGAAFEHLTLCNGIKTYMIPTLVKKDISKKISKFKPNHILMGPIHFEYICKDKRKRNWQQIINIVSGGDSMSAKLEDESNKKLKSNKVEVEVEQGYGESECFGACACNHNEFIQKGSVGIPHLLTNISIFECDELNDDYTTEFEVATGECGEICISSPVVMLGYLNNPEATDLVLKKHCDGRIWLHTGDIGYIDENGYIYITDRIKDLIFRNGFKVSPQKINKMIMEKFGEFIESSVVIGIPDEFERNVPVFFYKLKEQYKSYDDKFKTDLKKFYFENLSSLETPKDTVNLDEVPRTSVGKIDKKRIKSNYIENKCNETSSIKINVKKLLLRK